MLKQMNDLKKMANNLREQGKSEEQIKQIIQLYLNESKRKINPDGELDVI